MRERLVDNREGHTCFIHNMIIMQQTASNTPSLSFVHGLNWSHWFVFVTINPFVFMAKTMVTISNITFIVSHVDHHQHHRFRVWVFKTSGPRLFLARISYMLWGMNHIGWLQVVTRWYEEGLSDRQGMGIHEKCMDKSKKVFSVKGVAYQCLGFQEKGSIKVSMGMFEKAIRRSGCNNANKHRLWSSSFSFWHLSFPPWSHYENAQTQPISLYVKYDIFSIVGWKRFVDTTDESVKALRRDESIDHLAADGGGPDESIPKRSEPKDESFSSQSPSLSQATSESKYALNLIQPSFCVTNIWCIQH